MATGKKVLIISCDNNDTFMSFYRETEQQKSERGECMTDILQLSNQIFINSDPIFCEETLQDFSTEHQIVAPDLPSAENLVDLCNKCLERDDIEIRFHSIENFTFIEFLCGQKFEKNLQLFAELFVDGRQHICFQIVNCDNCIHTSSIAFASESESVVWDNAKSRDNDIRNCNDSSVFLGRAQYPLIPQDFAFIEHMYDNRLDRIKALFDKLRNILSYLYIANTSNIIGNKAVLQFDPTVNGYEYILDQLSINKCVWDIYSWIHKDEGSIDRAGIVRNIINIHCKTSDAMLNIDEKIYNSAVANYVIYQKKHTDQYIELKNKLSEFIVESAGQLQELAHDLVEGIRNNFVAVIVFLMTVLLTDSIDFSSFAQANVSSNIIAVCGIFTLVSLLYMIVTVIAGNTKWGWLEKSYKDLKNNYNGVLDERDIQMAVNNDAAFKNTKKNIKRFALQSA